MLRLRPGLEAIAARAGARIALVEVPPGPPVLATLVAEVVRRARRCPTSACAKPRASSADRLRASRWSSTSTPASRPITPRLVFVTDKEKAALSGVSTEDVARTAALALGGLDVRAACTCPARSNPLPIRLRLPRADRSGVERAAGPDRQGTARRREGARRRRACATRRCRWCGSASSGSFDQRPAEQTIYHKNLERVAYVYAETVGRAPAEVDRSTSAADLEPEPAFAVDDTRRTSIEPRPLWQRTFVSNGGGDSLGAAGGTRARLERRGRVEDHARRVPRPRHRLRRRLLGIYFLLVYQTGSYAMPLDPDDLDSADGDRHHARASGCSNLLSGGEVGGFPNPVFFTATAMIGMIALPGIAVRNAILLIEFVHVALAGGVTLRDALLRAGAVRTRAIVLTAGTRDARRRFRSRSIRSSRAWPGR